VAERALSDAEIEAEARSWTGDPRSGARLRAHYEIERDLARRLRDAPAADRASVYGEVYDELFRRVPDHPQLASQSSGLRQQNIALELQVLDRFIDPSDMILEIGAGDCLLSRQLARRARAVQAVDVSEEIAHNADNPPNLHVHVIDGVHIPVVPASITLAYSNQLMEHLHPGDARAQLAEIATALAPGGRYVVITPNGLTGPWDISRLFSTTPTGFHLREYTNSELTSLLRQAGFKRISAFVSVRGRVLEFPVAFLTLAERLLLALPVGAREKLLKIPVVAAPLKTVRLVAVRR
jgi:SAM-dependent methyltransferase